MRRAIVLVVAALAFIHVVSFDTAIVRYSSGYLETLNPFVGPWHPDVGAPAVVALQLVGLVILLSLAWWLFPQKTEPPSAMAETTEPDTDDYSDEPAAAVRH